MVNKGCLGSRLAVKVVVVTDFLVVHLLLRLNL